MNKILLFCLIGVAGLSIIHNGCVSEPRPPLHPPVPPPVFAAPPPLAFIPDMSDVYWAQNYPNLFFYSDNWYYYYNGWWYYSPLYNGPWIFIETARIPYNFYRIPPTYFRPPAQTEYRGDHNNRGGSDHRGSAQGQPGQGHGEHRSDRDSEHQKH